MTAATATLTDFLLARIAEDERAIRVGDLHYAECVWVAKDWMCDCDRATRVLAECAAYRAIVEEHQPIDYSTGPRCSTCCADWGDHYVGSPATEKMYPCPTIRAVAAVYADHPDYREEWRV